MDYSTLTNGILATLNASQKDAVKCPSSGVLQIVAGPGTGKTKVLVSRVAYLLLHEQILPHNIIVTTFTKKAANEMMERLREMLKGTEIVVGNLLIGTFHSICYKIIQKFGKRIGIENYAIADDRDALQILIDVLLKRVSDPEWDIIDLLPEEQTVPFRSKNESEKYRGYDMKKLRKKISQLKATGITIEDVGKSSENLFVQIVYTHYQQNLQTNKLLDFDDCLLSCYKIVSRFPVLSHIEHTLVDEFQDTNEIQLQLMYEFAKGHLTIPSLQHNVTIVGDPDQSIYAFRHAQSGNFDKMRQHYLQSHQIQARIISLTENYRSTTDILQVSENIMRQQTDRMTKNLRSQLDTSFKPMRADLESSDQEGRWIAYQIDHLKRFPDGLFNYSDMAILVRSAYQTRVIETELTKKKIPYFMVRGKAFWERKEVAAMVDYLRCVANENDRIALLRSSNFPKRGLGPKSVTELDSIIEKQQVLNVQNVSPILVFKTLRLVAESKFTCNLGPKVKQSLESFLDIIEDARKELNEMYQGANNQAAMDQFFLNLYVKSGIKKEFSEDVNCDLNIMEVKSQLMDFEMPPKTEFGNMTDTIDIENLQDSASDVIKVPSGTEFLLTFLSLVTLFDTNPDAKEGDENKPKVAISTIHGAKGLEWPVVFVPGVSEGLLPASFASADDNIESINEERRCFYVATSRAKTLLYLSSYTDGGNWGRRPIERPSRFLDKLGHMFSKNTPIDSEEKLDRLYDMMERSKTGKFDFAANHNRYEMCMKSFVSGQIEETPSDIGFTKVGKMTTREWKTNEILSKTSWKAPGTAWKPPGKVPERPASKAPAYIPMRPMTGPGKSTNSVGNSNGIINSKIQSIGNSTKTSNTTNFGTSVKQATNTNINSAVKRAPAYIPVRSGTKRRLGTR